jgi:hypothetical protein
MRTEEEIRKLIITMEDGLEKYKEQYNNMFLKNTVNGIPVLVEETDIYKIVKNQLVSLYWVLGENIKKGL